MKSVLLIDDEHQTIHLLKTYLEHLSVSSLAATSGLEGIEILKQNAAQIGLVFLDLAMPIMSGYEVSKYIRTDLQLDIPIVAITARVDIDAENRALEAGVTEVVHKPFELKTIQKLLAKLQLEY